MWYSKPERGFFRTFVSVWLSVYLQRWKFNYRIDFHQTRNKHNKVGHYRYSTLMLQHTGGRVVNEAAGRTSTEGERGHRLSRGWVSMSYVFTLYLQPFYWKFILPFVRNNLSENVCASFLAPYCLFLFAKYI